MSTLRAPFAGALEAAVRRALDAHDGDLDVVITPAMDAAHAEIVISENGLWRAAYYATLSVALDDHVEKIRRVFHAATAVEESRAVPTTITVDPSRTS